jgi:hypothetical protein
MHPWDSILVSVSFFAVVVVFLLDSLKMVVFFFCCFFALVLTERNDWFCFRNFDCKVFCVLFFDNPF